MPDPYDYPSLEELLLQRQQLDAEIERVMTSAAQGALALPPDEKLDIEQSMNVAAPLPPEEVDSLNDELASPLSPEEYDRQKYPEDYPAVPVEEFDLGAGTSWEDPKKGWLYTPHTGPAAGDAFPVPEGMSADNPEWDEFQAFAEGVDNKESVLPDEEAPPPTLAPQQPVEDENDPIWPRW